MRKALELLEKDRATAAADAKTVENYERKVMPELTRKVESACHPRKRQLLF
jgi:hypothetical protein